MLRPYPGEFPTWHDPTSPKGPPLTEAMVVECESRLSHTLPPEYIDLLRKTNGGRLRKRVWPVEKALYPGGSVDVHELFGIDKGDGEAAGLPNLSNYLVDEWQYPSPTVVLCSDGHTAVLLDYRNSEEEPSVIFYDDALQGDEKFFCLAKNFKTLINGLEYKTNFHQIGLTGLDDDTDLLPIFEDLGGDFKDRVFGGYELMPHGYKSRDGDEPFLWISENRYSDGSGWQFYELSDCKWIAYTNVIEDELDALLHQIDRASPGDIIIIARANRNYFSERDEN